MRSQDDFRNAWTVLDLNVIGGIALELFAEPDGIGFIGGQIGRQMLEFAVEPADFMVQPVTELCVGAGHGDSIVAASKTARIRQPSHPALDGRVATAPGTNHEQDRSCVRVGEDVFDVLLERRDRVASGEEVAEREESVAVIRVGFPIRLLWCVKGIGVPLLPLLVVILLVLVP